MGRSQLVKLLLDTHIWLWSLGEPRNLKPRIARELASSDNDLWLSPLSIWEFFILSSRGRVALYEPAEEVARQALANTALKEAPVTADVVMATRSVKLEHRDPVDWFLAATARAFDLTLVTADQKLLRGGGFSVLANH